MKSDGQGVAVTKEDAGNGYGENTTVGVPSGVDWSTTSRADTAYTVIVANVRVPSDGRANELTRRDFEYEVVIFSLARSLFLPALFRASRSAGW